MTNFKVGEWVLFTSSDGSELSDTGIVVGFGENIERCRVEWDSESSVSDPLKCRLEKIEVPSQEVLLKFRSVKEYRRSHIIQPHVKLDKTYTIAELRKMTLEQISKLIA